MFGKDFWDWWIGFIDCCVIGGKCIVFIDECVEFFVYLGMMVFVCVYDYWELGMVNFVSGYVE